MADFTKLSPEKRERMCKTLLNRYKRCVGTTLLDNPMEVTEKCGGLYLDMTDLCGDDLAVSLLPLQAALLPAHPTHLLRKCINIPAENLNQNHEASNADASPAAITVPYATVTNPQQRCPQAESEHLN